MLIKCPECTLQVSNQAVMCPHCGYPISGDPIKISRTKKRKRLPNGFGQITKLKNSKLRKPFRAMVTIGKTPEGKPVCKLLKPESYFKTYNEAYEALVKYNLNPYDMDRTSTTLKDLYEQWSKQYFEQVQRSQKNAIKNAWNNVELLHSMKVYEIRTRHIKECISNSNITTYGKIVMKTMFNMLFDYALEYELCDKNYSRNFKLPKEYYQSLEDKRTPHLSYTDDEIKTLWENITKVDYVDVLLFNCYTGWRPKELANIKLEDVDLINNCITGGTKTAAGKNRTVPIHSAIRNIVEKMYNNSKENNFEYLISYKSVKSGRLLKMSYWNYEDVLEYLKEKLNINPKHKLHDARKHFITTAKKYNVDEYAIKRIVGHSISDITEKIYTDRNPDWLHTEIEKIKVNEYDTSV